MDIELACAHCGEAGGIFRYVSMEYETTRPVNATMVDGVVTIEEGPIEKEYGSAEVSDEGLFACDFCQHTWPENEMEANVSPPVKEWRCDVCGWWGLQEWLHPIEMPGCNGQLRGLKHPKTKAMTLSLMKN